MTTARRTFPVYLRTPWADFAPALHWFTAQTVTSLLAAFSPRIRAVHVRIEDGHGRDVEQRRCTLHVDLAPTGSVSATATGIGLHSVVERAAERARAALEHDSAREQVNGRVSRIA